MMLIIRSPLGSEVGRAFLFDAAAKKMKRKRAGGDPKPILGRTSYLTEISYLGPEVSSQ